MRNWKSNCQTCNKPIPYGNNCGQCKVKARQLASAEKKRQKEKKAIKVCPQCQSTFKSYDKIKVLCSVKCAGIKKRKKRIAVNCCVCNKQIERTESDLKKRLTFCCSLECQNKYWGESGRTVTEKGEARRRQKVKRAWQSQRSAKRKKTSVAYKWWLKCRNVSSNKTDEKSEWEKKCDVVAVGIKKRPPSKSNSRKTKAVKKWEKAITKTIRRLEQKLTRSNWNGWERCCNSVMRNIRSRSKN